MFKTRYPSFASFFQSSHRGLFLVFRCPRETEPLIQKTLPSIYQIFCKSLNRPTHVNFQFENVLFLHILHFILFLWFCYNLLCALIFCLNVCLCEGIRSLGTGVTDSCELLCGCWELNLSPLEEQPVLLTVEPFTEPSDHHDLSHLPLPAWPP